MFKGLGKAEMEKRLKEFQMELVKLNAQVATGTTLKNPSQVGETKKNIARLKTLIKTEK